MSCERGTATAMQELMERLYRSRAKLTALAEFHLDYGCSQDAAAAAACLSAKKCQVTRREARSVF